MNDRYQSSLISILLLLLCVITTTQVVEAGYLFTAGSNSSQQLGHSGSELGRVQGDLLFQNVTAVDAGENFSLAILNGKVYSWGTHPNALGVNSTFTSTNVPTLLKGSLTGRVATVVRACQNHALAVDSLGKVHAWGLNAHYSLGTGDVTTTYAPTMVTFSSNVSDVCCGTDYTVALTTAGAVYTWGIRIGGGADIMTPTAKGLTGITKITCGRAHAAVLSSSGVLYNWGMNTKTQLGKADLLGLTSDFAHNALSVASKTVVDIASGGDNGYAVTSDGSLYAWGDDSQGQLGIGGVILLGGAPELVVSSGVTKIVVSNFKPTALITTTLNNVLSIGSGLLGLLGLGGGSNSPVALPNLLPQSAFSKISLGASHSLFILSGTTCNLLFNGEVGVCSGRGNCSQIDSCECPLEQYTGWNCHLPVCFGLASDSLSVCSLNGNCSDPNSCICDVGFTGANCSIPMCYEHSALDVLNVCSGHGLCLGKDTCECLPLWTGANCSIPVPLCFGHSALDLLHVCSGNGQCTSGDNCICNIGFTGINCSVPLCYGHSALDILNVCSGHGLCLGKDDCLCNPMWTGPNCSTPTCFGHSALDLLHVCSGNGQCTSGDNCICEIGFTGINCSIPMCYEHSALDILNVCSGHGLCLGKDNCLCNPLWGGSNCSLPLCGGLLGDDHLNVCGGRGNCLLPNLCDCSSGFGGLLCELTDCFGFLSNDSLNVCSSHGQCIAPNLCLCSDEHEGPLCDILKTFTIGFHGLNELDSVCGGLNVTASISSVSLFSLVSISWSMRQNGISTPLTQTSGYSLHVLPELGAGEFTLVATATANISGLVLEKTAELKLHFDCGLPPLCFLQESISNCSYHIGFADNGNSIIPGVKHLFSRHRPLTLVPSIVNNLGQLVLDKLGFSFDWAVGSSALNSNLLTINGFNQSELVLNPVSAVEGMGDLTVNITLTITTPLGGVATIPFILKSRPYIPMVTVPNNCLTASLTSLSDFRISANNWGSGLVFYYFSYYYNATKVTVKSSTNSTVSASLPAGQQRNSTLGLIVSVIESTANEDRLGTCSFNLTIPALLPNITAITNGVKNILDKVTNLTQVVEGPISNIIANILDDTITSINQIQGNVTVELLKDYLTITNVILNHQSVMNETSLLTALKIVHAVLNAATSTSTISTPIFHEQEAQMVVTILSNVSTHEYRTSESLGDELMDTVKAMVTLMLSGMSVGDAPMVLTSQLLEVIIGLDNCSNLALAPVELPHKGSSFLIPSSFSDNVNSDVVAYSMVVFKNNPYAWGSVNDTNRMSSPVLDLTFRYHDGPDMHVAELSEPIILQLQCSSGSCEDKRYDCGYWDEVQKLWKTDGCYMLKSDAQSIYCACNHTTSFSAFILETGDTTVKYMEVKIAGIAINTVYIVICSAILVGLVLTYNTQPVRSRFIAPHLGMTAIIVDSVLQGWIRNSLSLAGKHVASDAFSYVIMLSANPLTVVMLFVFLWQQIRFILHQNIYHIMGSTSPKQRQHFMRISKIIVSKWVFSIVALVVGLCVMAVFAILVGLAAGLYNKGTSTTNRTKIVTVQALVYAGMMILLALAILATMIIDYLGSMKRALINERNSRLGTTQEPNAFKKERSIQGLLQFPTKFFRDDVLWFRTEACFIFVAICLLIATYSVGIASLVVESKTYSPLDIVRTVLEFTHIFVKIAAFGGAVLVFSIIGVFRRGTSCISPTGYNTSSTASDSDAIMGEMLILLRHEHGYYVAFRYFQLESSLENLLLWKDLEQLKTNGPIMSASQRKSALDAIHDLYLKKNSEREFNISGARKKSFIQKIEPAELSLEEFEKAIRILYSMAMDNIGDTFSRFISTREYAGFLASRRISRELAEISTTN